MKVHWRSFGVSAAVCVVVLSMSGCATPPRVEVTQRDDYKLDCVQLEAEFATAQNVRVVRRPTTSSAQCLFLKR